MIKIHGICLFSFLVFAGCQGQWPASMAQQPSVQPLTLPRPAPVGSVQVGGVEHLEDRQDDADLVSPLPREATVLTLGQQLFGYHCAVCHGDDGHGNGPVSKLFPPAPDLRHVSICGRSDGFIYGTITAGGRAMPSLREGLSARDRWSLVAWVREIQRPGCVGQVAAPEAAEAPAADAPADSSAAAAPAEPSAAATEGAGQ